MHKSDFFKKAFFFSILKSLLGLLKVFSRKKQHQLLIVRVASALFHFYLAFFTIYF